MYFFFLKKRSTAALEALRRKRDVVGGAAGGGLAGMAYGVSGEVVYIYIYIQCTNRDSPSIYNSILQIYINK